MIVSFILMIYTYHSMLLQLALYLDTEPKSISNAILSRAIVRENGILIIHDLFVRLENEEN